MNNNCEICNKKRCSCIFCNGKDATHCINHSDSFKITVGRDDNNVVTCIPCFQQHKCIIQNCNNMYIPCQKCGKLKDKRCGDHYNKSGWCYDCTVYYKQNKDKIYKLGDITAPWHGNQKIMDVVDDLIIIDMCVETYPCYHSVIKDDELFEMDGISIYDYYVKKGKKPDLHFEEYKDWSDEE